MNTKPSTLVPDETVAASVAAGPHVSERRTNPADPLPKPPAPDPTRYGDWEKNGRCIDF